MGLLDGKRLLVTGVLTKDSLAFAVADLAHREGAELVLTGAGRGLSLTQRTARKLCADLDVLEFDVTDDSHAAAVRRRSGRQVGPRRRGAARHRLRPASPPSAATSCRPSGTTWPWPCTSRPGRCGPLADAVDPAHDRGRLHRRPRLRRPGGLARLRLDGRLQGRPGVDLPLPGPGPRRPAASASTWSPPARSARWPPGRSPASSCSRTSGTTAPRSAGPSGTPTVVAKACVALLSDWFPATTGEIIHVDGGYHAMGV